MAAESYGQFECSACARSFGWKPELAGRKVKCGCGQVMVAPMVAPGESDLYELAEAKVEPIPAAQLKAIAEKNSVKPIEYQKPTTPGTSPAERYFPDRGRDLYMPLILIGGGLIVRFGYIALFTPISQITLSLPMRLARVGLEVCVVTAIMLAGVMIAGKLRHIDFGPLPVAIMKLCAVAIAPVAIGILLAPLFRIIPIFGGLGRSIVTFAMAFALMGAMFDLEESDTWYCICIMVVIGIAGQLAILWFWK